MEIENRKRQYAVARGVWRLKDIFVNAYIVETHNGWVLVDAGLKTTARKIRNLASDLFGKESKPLAIVLTHGHFDHVGSIDSLEEEWKVPIYAHSMEVPYLTGKSSYPPPDPEVGGGLMATFSFMYPKGPINVAQYLQTLPADGSIPVMPEWRYLHTPGHAPGHISLFREADRVLLAGDAFVTTKQESAVKAILQPKEIHGPPKYFTYDWKASEESVRKLERLKPEVIATGHGQPLYGETMRRSLENLVNNFEELAVPKEGRYVNNPALVDENGVQAV